jgi:hypothetical protein
MSYVGSSRGLEEIREIVLCDWSGWSIEQVVLVIVHGGVESLAGFFSFESCFKKALKHSFLLENGLMIMLLSNNLLYFFIEWLTFLFNLLFGLIFSTFAKTLQSGLKEEKSLSFNRDEY